MWFHSGESSAPFNLRLATTEGSGDRFTLSVTETVNLPTDKCWHREGQGGRDGVETYDEYYMMVSTNFYMPV